MKILIIHTFGLGDMIMFTPTLQKLRELYPEAKVDFLIFQKITAEPIKKFPNLNKIYYTDFNLKDIFNVLKEIRKNYYDLSIITSGPNPLKTGLFNLFIKSKIKVGEIRKPYQRVFFDKPIKYIENIHRVENNYSFVADAKKVEYPTKFFGIENKKEPHQKIIVGIHAGSHPTGKHKRWKKKYFVQLINALKKEYKNLEFIIFAGPAEIEESQYIAKNSDAKLVINRPLLEVTKMISNCDIFINTDSGLGHIAGCFDMEIFTIFGPAKDYKAKVYNKNAYAIKLGLECQPCHDTVREKRCQHFRCLNDLTPDIVLSFIKKNSKVLKNA